MEVKGLGCPLYLSTRLGTKHHPFVTPGKCVFAVFENDLIALFWCLLSYVIWWVALGHARGCKSFCPLPQAGQKTEVPCYVRC